VTCPLLCCLDVTACEPLHHQHIPVAHMAQVPVEGGPWFLGVGHQTVALSHFLGRKTSCCCGFHLERRHGSFKSFWWWDHFHFLQSGIVDSWLPMGRGSIPFTLVAELPGAPATYSFDLLAVDFFLFAVAIQGARFAYPCLHPPKLQLRRQCLLMSPMWDFAPAAMDQYHKVRS
jgi:hypothetical protein